MNGDVTLVVVGAGASFGCVQSALAGVIRPPATSRFRDSYQFESVRPPVTQNLVEPSQFSNSLVARYPRAQPVVEHLRRALHNGSDKSLSLEQALADYQKLGAHNPEIEPRLLHFRFFLRDLLLGCSEYMASVDVAGGRTAYTGLVDVLHNWACETASHVAFVSFNYDILLDRACHAAWGLNMRDMASYGNPDGPASLVKPHGSVLWGWEMLEGTPTVSWPDPELALRTVEQSNLSHPAVDTEPFVVDYLLDPDDPDPIGRQQRRPVMPALALPVFDKTQFVWSSAQRDHIASLQGRVNRVLLIGWQAMEPHFLELLNDILTPGYRMVVVNGRGTDSAVVAKRVRGKSGVYGDDTQLAGGFYSFVTGTRDELTWLLSDQ